MAGVMRCPKCQGTIDLNAVDPAGVISCSGCGARFRIKQKPQESSAKQSPADPQAPRVPPPKPAPAPNTEKSGRDHSSSRIRRDAEEPDADYGDYSDDAAANGEYSSQDDHDGDEDARGEHRSRADEDYDSDEDPYGGEHPYGDHNTYGDDDPYGGSVSDEVNAPTLQKRGQQSPTRTTGNKRSAVREAEPHDEDEGKKSFVIAGVAAGVVMLLLAIGLAIWQFSQPRGGDEVVDAEEAENEPVGAAVRKRTKPMKGKFAVIDYTESRLDESCVLAGRSKAVTLPEMVLTKAVPFRPFFRDSTQDGVPVPLEPPEFVTPKADLALGPTQWGILMTPNRSHAAVYNISDAHYASSVYDLATGEEITRFARDTIYGPFARLSFDGRRCLSGAEDSGSLARGIEVWRGDKENPVPPDKPEFRFAEDRVIEWLEVIDEHHVAILCQMPQSAVEIWNFETQELAGSIGIDPYLQRPDDTATDGRPSALSPDGRFLAVVRNEAIQVVDLRDRKPVGNFPRPATGEVWSITFLPVSRQLAILTVLPHSESRLRAWDLNTGQLSADVPVGISLFSQPRKLTIAERGVPREIILQDTANAIAIDTMDGQLLQMDGLSFAQFNPPTPDMSLYFLPTAGQSRDIRMPAAVSARLKADPQLNWGWLFASAPQHPAAPVESFFAPPAIKTVEPPAEWTAPPIATRNDPPNRFEAWHGWPSLITPNMNVAFEVVNHELPDRQNRTEIIAHRYDRVTDENLPPLTVCPALERPGFQDPDLIVRNSLVEKLQAAAVSSKGQLAYVPPHDRRALSIYDREGKPLGTFTLADPVRWMSFAADGNLIIESSGTVTSWNPATWKPAWSVRGEYLGPADMVQSGVWAVFHTATHVDVLELATGRCLGQLPAMEGTFLSRRLKLSPDGSRLLISHYKAAYAGSQTIQEVVWDLSTRDQIVFPEVPVNSDSDTGWVAPAVLFHSAFDSYYTDLLAGDGRGMRFMAALPKSETLGHYRYDKSPPRAAPDGQLVVTVLPVDARGESTWSQYIWCPVESDELALLRDPQRRHYSLFSRPVRVELDCGDEVISGITAKSLAFELARGGGKIGNDGWTLRIRNELMNAAPGADGQLAQGQLDTMSRFSLQVIDSAVKTARWTAVYETTVIRPSEKLPAYQATERLVEPPPIEGLVGQPPVTNEVLSLDSQPEVIFTQIFNHNMQGQDNWGHKIPVHFIASDTRQAMIPSLLPAEIKLPQGDVGARNPNHE